MSAANVLEIPVKPHAGAGEYVLGALLCDLAAWDKISGTVTPEHFSRPDHQTIFRAMAALRFNDQPIDLKTVCQYLERGNELDVAGGQPYILKLARETATAENIVTYAHMLIADWQQRGITSTYEAALALDGSPTERIAYLLTELGQLQAVPATKPTPLLRALPSADDFPLDALGPILGAAARALIDIAQVPAALAGNSVLAAAGLCAQAQANVQTLGGTRPLSLFTLTIAESGERKSTADRIALQPVSDYVRQLAKEYRTQMKDFEANSEGHKTKIRKIKDDAENDAEKVTAGLKALAKDEPLVPRKPFMLCTEPSAEGLIISLQDGQLSQGVFSDEAGSFIGGHALSDDAELRTIATLSQAWDGRQLDRVRAKDREHTTLYGRRLSVHLMAQPEVAARMIGKPLYRSQGFLARFLMAQPASIIGTRHHDGQALEAAEDGRIQAYWRALSKLLDIKPNEDKELGGLSPPLLRLTDTALRFLVDSYNAIEADQGEQGPLALIRDFASKSAEHACRIAGVLTLISDPAALYVDQPVMEQAFALVQFYLGEQIRLCGHAVVSLETQNGQRLLEWIMARGETELTPRKVMQYGPSSIRESGTAKAALRLLVSNGWLTTRDEKTFRLAPGAVEAWQERNSCTD